MNFALTSKASFLHILNTYPEIPLVSFGSSGIDRFKDLVKTHGKHVTSVNLDGMDLSNFSVATLTAKCPCLERIRCNVFLDKDFQHLSKLTKLRQLNLSECWNITNEGLKELTKLTGLHLLDLFFCHKITNEGLKELSKLKRLRIVI